MPKNYRRTSEIREIGKADDCLIQIGKCLIQISKHLLNVASSRQNSLLRIFIENRTRNLLFLKEIVSLGFVDIFTRWTCPDEGEKMTVIGIATCPDCIIITASLLPILIRIQGQCRFLFNLPWLSNTSCLQLRWLLKQLQVESHEKGAMPWSKQLL